jgi:hypothetical protein
MINDALTVVVQGPFEPYTNEVIKSYLDSGIAQEVIVSCWAENNTESFAYADDNRVKLLKNEMIPVPGTDNRNMQIVSSAAGIKLSTSKTTVKVRSDQVYTHESLILLDQYYKQTKILGDKKIFVAGIYPHLLFHPCDHIFWGQTEDVLQLFDIPIELNGLIDKIRVPKNKLHEYYPFFVRTETYICSRYCAQLDNIINKYVLQPENYLYDKAKWWEEAQFYSRLSMPKLFKSFPRTGLQMYWSSKGAYYPYESQRHTTNHCWAEEGY